MIERCHNCGTSDLAALYTAPAFDAPLGTGRSEYRLARCSNCGLVNTMGITASAVGDTYSDAYYGSGEQKFAPLAEAIVRVAAGFDSQRMLRLWGGDSPPRVLDIGCGRGVLLHAFRARGAAVQGIERGEFPVDDDSAALVTTNALDSDFFTNRSFDIIVLRHVFEHLDEQDAVLDSIASHLAPGGIVVIAVPNFASAQQSLFGRYWFHLDLPRHLVHIEPNWLRQRLQARQLNVIHASQLDLVQNTYGFIQSTMNSVWPRRLNEFYRLLKHHQSAASHRFIALAGYSALAALLLPFALVETALGALLGRGATLHIIARRESNT